MDNKLQTTIKSLDIEKKTKIFNVIVNNNEKYTVNNNGIFIDYLKLSEQSQKAILEIIGKL